MGLRIAASLGLGVSVHELTALSPALLGDNLRLGLLGASTQSLSHFLTVLPQLSVVVLQWWLAS